ncbi:MAG: RagB/SusD family nutrient uptake outer membrane protein, partial [Chitinophagaceae bacterium]
MKKYYFAGILLSALVLSSCEDELNVIPVGVQTLQEADTTPTQAQIENTLRASYDLLSNRLNILATWDWGGGLVFQNDYILQDIASDDMIKKWSPDGDQPWIDEINNFSFVSTNG